jgi:hypothetical protein
MACSSILVIARVYYINLMTFLSVDRQISFFNQECPSTSLVTTIRISRKHTAGNLVAQI